MKQRIALINIKVIHPPFLSLPNHDFELKDLNSKYLDPKISGKKRDAGDWMSLLYERGMYKYCYPARKKSPYLITKEEGDTLPYPTRDV